MPTLRERSKLVRIFVCEVVFYCKTEHQRYTQSERARMNVRLAKRVDDVQEFQSLDDVE